ncbi:MAG TPA: hypothetical protein VE222_13685, partial [Nitrospiraceae bacterium]|nr:hypothetical protein [Nitrospiraceae bacterium]
TRILNVASTADNTLRFVFPVGDWFAGIFSGGYTRPALGYRGPAASPPAPERARSFPVGRFNVDHGDYLGGDSSLRRRASAFAGRAIEQEEPLEY